MIRIQYLSNLKGGARFGACSSCGKGSKEDPAMVKVEFRVDGNAGGTAVFLCNECLEKLYHMI